MGGWSLIVVMIVVLVVYEVGEGGRGGVKRFGDVVLGLWVISCLFRNEVVSFVWFGFCVLRNYL